MRALCRRSDPRYDEITVPFDPNSLAPRGHRLSRRQVHALYPGDPRAHYERGMLAWSLAFYAGYLLYSLERVPGWAFGVLGFVFVLRYFNRWHEAIHADQRGAASWHPARALLVIMGPIYLGRRELEDMHLAHHREDGGPLDPHRRMGQPSPVRAAFWCLIEPEMAVWTHLRRHGLDAALAARMAAHALVWAGLMWLGGWRGLVAYNLVTRLGNGVAWFVFSWLVHRPWLYGQIRPPAFPRPLAALWVALVGGENLDGVRYHYLHHLFPWVPDRALGALSRRLGARTEGA